MPNTVILFTNKRWVRQTEWGTSLGFCVFLLFVVPILYKMGAVDITTVNKFGRYLSFAIVAIGVDLIWGYTGILSLCQAMFFCFGGYAIGMHMALHGPLDGDHIPRCLFVVSSVVQGLQLPWFWKPFQTLPAAIILSMLVPGAVALVFGFFAFRSRVRGVYFSIITQATTLAAVLIFRRNESQLCGTNGLTNFVTLGGFNLNAPSVKLGLYIITVITLIGAYLVSLFICKSRLGRLMVAVRDSESRLRFAGYEPVKIKVFAFTVGAILAGLGGMLYTPQNGIITPFTMEPAASILMVIWVAVGGRGTLSGAVVGALIVSALYSWLTSTFPAAWPFVEGAMFILVTLFYPDGAIGYWLKLTHREITPPGEEDPAESMAPALAAGEGVTR